MANVPLHSSHDATRTYRWNGTDRAGKRIRGVTVAAGEAALRAELWRQGIVPSRVRRSLLTGAGRVRSEEITAATRQLATMIRAGIPLVQAFDIIGNSQDTPAVQTLILRVKNDIEGGTALSAALARYPRHFDDLYVNLVAAGEQAGALEALLAKIAAYREKTQSIKYKIRKALLYPLAVTAVALLVTVILLVFVIPQFESLFAGFGAELPALTLMVIAASDFVRTSGWTLGLALAIGAVAFVQARRRSRPVRHWLERATLRAPVIGSIVDMAATARYARTLAITFSAGTPLVQALEPVARSTGNIVYEGAVLNIRDEVATGQPLEQAMKLSGVFPTIATRMIGVGEKSGALDDMAERVADFYEERLDNAVDGLASLLEPLIMAVLGVIVGGLVVAMYLPVFQMGQVM